MTEHDSGLMAAELVDPQAIFAKTLRHFLAPVWPYLEDPTVVEVMINGADEVYVEQRGKLVLTEELKMLPLGAVYDYFCLRNNVPAGADYMDEIDLYEKKVQSKRS